MGPSSDIDYKNKLDKNPKKATENYDDLSAFENRCSINSISLHKAATMPR
jgi:hypothetical protein